MLCLGPNIKTCFFLCIQHINFIVCAKCIIKHSAERRAVSGWNSWEHCPRTGGERRPLYKVCNFVLVSNSNNDQNSPKLPNVII